MLSFTKPLRPQPERTKTDPVAATVDAVSEMRERIEKPERYREEQKRQDTWRDACDSEYWMCLCFASREEKASFIEAAGLQGLPDKHVDAADVADRLGIEMPPRAKKPLGAKRRIGSRFLRFVR